MPPMFWLFGNLKRWQHPALRLTRSIPASCFVFRALNGECGLLGFRVRLFGTRFSDESDFSTHKTQFVL